MPIRRSRRIILMLFEIINVSTYSSPVHSVPFRNNSHNSHSNNKKQLLWLLLMLVVVGVVLSIVQLLWRIRINTFTTTAISVITSIIIINITISF